MKAIFQFDLNDETDEYLYDKCINAEKYYGFIEELLSYLREVYKYDRDVEENKLDHDTVEFIREKIYELLDSNNVVMD